MSLELLQRVNVCKANVWNYDLSKFVGSYIELGRLMSIFIHLPFDLLTLG